MSRPTRPPWAPERLDETGHDAYVLAESLRDVARANHWFGGTRSLRRSLRDLARLDRLSILDVGTGSGELLRSLVDWLGSRGVNVRAAGIDASDDILRIAVQAGVPLVRGDACRLPFADRAFDVVCATLTLHHIPDALQTVALREMARVARRRVLVAELERSWIHLAGARLLAASLWRGNPITRHDAPVSVRRGYAPGELDRLAADCGLRGRTARFPFYRLVLSIEMDPYRGRPYGSGAGT